MPSAYLELQGCRFELLADWEQRLREASPGGPSGEIMLRGFQMVQTLAEFETLLSSEGIKHWPERPPPPISQLRADCRCGRNPELAYFETGAAALRRLKCRVGAQSQLRLDQAWYWIAQREVQRVCGACPRAREVAPLPPHPVRPGDP